MKDCVQKFVFESDDKIVISSNVIRSCLNMTLPLLYRLCIDVFFKPIRVLAEIKQRGIPMNFRLSIKQVFFLRIDYLQFHFRFIGVPISHCKIIVQRNADKPSEKKCHDSKVFESSLTKIY